jgi:hypothetical protein
LLAFERDDREPLSLESANAPASWRILRPRLRAQGYEVDVA